MIMLWFMYFGCLIFDFFQIAKMLLFLCFESLHKKYLLDEIKLDLFDMKFHLSNLLTAHEIFMLGVMSCHIDRIIYQQIIFSVKQLKEDLLRDGMSCQTIFRVY